MHTRLYLCRHGEVVGDGRKRYNGHRDVDITEKGVAQMERLRETLKDAPLSAIYSSDLIRTLKGAAIVGEFHDGARKVSMPEFRERHVGLWEGLAWEELEAQYPDEWKGWLADIVNFVSPYNWVFEYPRLAGWASLEEARPLARLDAEVTRQALMIGYIDVFYLSAWMAMLSLPFVALIARARDEGAN
jgi:broad specificity phosphatase PhoE